MSYLLAIFLGIVIIGVATIWFLPGDQKPPKMYDIYWGPSDEPKKIDESIRPFNINFSEEMIEDLRRRLKNTRELHPSLENVGWTYGIRADYVSKVVGYWLNKYDFKKREAYLNQYPQFLTNIHGLDIHFVHVKPQVPKDRKINVLPLYMQHGWPGSVVEFYKIIPLLTTPKPNYDFVFEVIAPSLPGFGYSDVTTKVGMTATEMAHLIKHLMQKLGFQKWYTQGGDWGAIVTANMASIYPQHVLGMHSNMCIVLRLKTILKQVIYSLWPSLLLPEDEIPYMYPLRKLILPYLLETGYLHEQATKPDTLGVAISDSPAGLAAYILQIFSSGTNMQNLYDENGGIGDKFTMDELIDNLMYYWVPNKVTSSFRIYAESLGARHMKLKMDNVPVTVPSACAQFPNEIIFQPEEFLRDRFINLVHRKKMPSGGHFAAMEEPELLTNDIFEAVQKMREFHALNEKKRLEQQEL